MRIKCLAKKGTTAAASRFELGTSCMIESLWSYPLSQGCHSKFSFPPITHAHFPLHFPYAHRPSFHIQSPWKGLRMPRAPSVRVCACFLKLQLHSILYASREATHTFLIKTTHSRTIFTHQCSYRAH